MAKRRKRKAQLEHCLNCVFWTRVHEHVGVCESRDEKMNTPEDFGCEDWRENMDNPDFEKWWSVYPKVRRRNKKAARKKFEKIVASGVPSGLLINAVVERRGMEKDEKFAPLPTTWLNQECWIGEESKPVDSQCALIHNTDPRFYDLKHRYEAENPGKRVNTNAWAFPKEWL